MQKRGNLSWVLATLGFVVFLVLVLPYLRFTVFETQSQAAFSGEFWYVPYQDLADTLVKANFHAHGRAWGGLTWGEDHSSEVIEAYAQRGYQLPAMSNYHKIMPATSYADSLIYLPVYEHGNNLKKVHCLCIGASEVSFWEYPWHFSFDHTRETIQRLGPMCELVALAHPGARNAHEPAEMPELYGIDLMEVGNTMGMRTEYWDATLSRGNPVWILSNDDTHDLMGKEIFIRWNMIYVNEPTRESIIGSLREGNHYGVYSYDRKCEDNRLVKFEVKDDTLRIAVRDTFNRLDLYGQGGKELLVAYRDNEIHYALQPSDKYVRAEVHHDHCVMYLNPVIRYDGITPPYLDRPAVRVTYAQTWLVRILVGMVLVLGCIAWYRIVFSSKPHAS